MKQLPQLVYEVLPEVDIHPSLLAVPEILDVMTDDLRRRFVGIEEM